jgi:hypothetical protein
MSTATEQGVFLMMTSLGIIFIIAAIIFYLFAFIESLDEKNYDLPRGLAMFGSILLIFGVLCLIEI